jgi:hypothetical protein
MPVRSAWMRAMRAAQMACLGPPPSQVPHLSTRGGWADDAMGQNVEKEFDGIEECPICYSVVHTSDRSLPRLRCKTCKHKFHSACLYKWFSTSQKSTCPLCQTPF